VLGVVGVLGLRAVGRLASVNREITTRTVPALRLAASTRDAVPALVRLEARFLALNDTRFIGAWNERADRLRASLIRLHEYPTNAQETRLLEDASESFERYYGTVGQIQALLARGQRVRAAALSEGASRALTDRIEASLEALTESMHADVLQAQAEVARLEARTWSGVMVAMGAAVGLALLGSGLIAHRMTQSLQKPPPPPGRAAGSFEEPIDVEGRDEVAQLARSFSAMARELRRMEETKEEFFASVSHELRSPLTSIREGSHLLRDRVSGPLNDKQRRLVEIIAAGADRLLGLVNQILEVSRLRAGVCCRSSGCAST
jgi:signal transduction histidine kinase